MNIFAYTLIIILLATEVYCAWWIKEYLREQSEKRTERRRAYYRRRAYKDKAEKRTLKNNREMLFKAISKEVKR